MVHELPFLKSFLAYVQMLSVCEECPNTKKILKKFEKILKIFFHKTNSQYHI